MTVGLDTIEGWYRKYGPMVHRRCLRLLGDEQRATEATQDVFVQVLRRREALEAEAPSSLLFRVATNVSLNLIRSAGRRPEVASGETIEWLAAWGDGEGSVQARQWLEKIFRREKESTRYIAVLHLLDGMTLEEVAEEVGMSVSGVRKRLRQLTSKAGRMQALAWEEET